MSAYAALQVKDFRWFLSKRLLWTLSVQIMSVCVGYFIYEQTQDPWKLGLVGLAEAVPAISVSLWAGHIADKYDRRSILACCAILLLCCCEGLLYLVVHRVELGQEVVINGVFALIFCTGIARGFFSPTNFAFMPQLVDKDTLANAITWNSSAWEVASISGLGIGGVLYGFLGVEAAFGTMTLLVSFALVCLAMIEGKPVPPVEVMEPAWVRIKEGLRFVAGNRLIIATISLDLFAVLFGGAVALIPVYAKDILMVGPQGAASLRVAMSVGAILMAFFIAYRPPGSRAGYVLLASVAGFGLCMIGFGVSKWFWLSALFLFLAGVFDEVSVFVRSALLQFQTPANMKGRVSSVNSIFITSSNEIGAFESGTAAGLMGTVPSVVFGGCMTLLIVAAVAWRSPELRNLDFRDVQKNE
jgi:MFS family permease